MFSKIYIIHTIHVIQKLFYYTQLKLKNKEQQQKRDEETGKHKLNEMGTLNMKQKE